MGWQGKSNSEGAYWESDELLATDTDTSLVVQKLPVSMNKVNARHAGFVKKDR
jgi:hypothetical protein